MGMIHIQGLLRELATAGIAVGGCNSDGKVWDVNGLEIQARPDVAAVIATHNAQAWATIDQQSATRAAAAKATAKAIPNWATWSQQDWTNYFNSNLSDTEADLVTSFAAARIMIKRQNLVIHNLVKLVIALRDQIWPDLPV
jgi:hypothetical protein